MAGSRRLGILLDLDETLVLTASIEPLRRARRWSAAEASFGQTRLPAGTYEFINSLRPYGPFGVVTNAPRIYAERLLRFHALDVPVLVAYHDTLAHKPDPSPLRAACERLGLPVTDCVHIGDLPTDDDAARAAGMRPIRVDWVDPAMTWDAVLEVVARCAREDRPEGH